MIIQIASKLLRTTATLAAALMISAFAARAQPTVLTTTDFDALQAAIVSDTNIVLKFDGVVRFTRQIYITAPVTLDGSDHNVIFEGADSRLFRIISGGDLTIKSVTLRNTKLQDTPAVPSGGGAAFLVNDGSLTLNNCLVVNNEVRGYSLVPAGFGPISSSGHAGAIHAWNARLTFFNSTFQGNLAIGGDGSSGNMAEGATAGAILARSCQIKISHCTFDSNAARAGAQPFPFNPYISLFSAVNGGAIWASGGKLEIEQSVFKKNTCLGSRLERFEDVIGGGAIYAENASVEIRSSSFTENSISSDSFAGVGGAICLDNCAFLLDGSAFSFNTVSPGIGGGAIALMGLPSEPSQIYRSAFTSNTATAYRSFNLSGGAIITQSPTILDQSVFTFNIASGSSYLVTSNLASTYPVNTYYFVTNPPTRGLGGAIYSPDLKATNCVFYGNSVRSGDGSPPGAAKNYPSEPSTGAAIAGGKIQLTAVSFASNNVEIANYPAPNTSPKGTALNASSGNTQASLFSRRDDAPLLEGPIADLGFNICADNSAAFTQPTSLNNTDPLLQYFPNQKFGILRPAPNSPAIGRVTTRLTDYDIRGALRGPLPHDSGAVELDATTDLAFTKTVNTLRITAPNYSETFKLLQSPDLKTWTDLNPAPNTTFEIPITPNTPTAFLKAQLSP